ncbi:hypothetical protein E4U55_000589 [Claviceps digitariae]|nr:hypothetical protein E4U55_000589 [Claviceps digitariae]
MASLRNIMNVDVDDDHVSSSSVQDTGSKPSQHRDSSMVTGARGSLDTSPSQNQGLNPSTRSLNSPSKGKNTSTMPYNHLLTPSPSGRRQSNTSTESIDSHHGQGNRHGQTGLSAKTPLRPYVPQEPPVKLTPITGRVSRAKKGEPVHTCELCRPTKTFTRAEHLRRHQLSHKPPDLRCPVPGCDKAFHRRDLLERHQLRHDEDHRVGKGKSATQTRSPRSARSRRRKSTYTTSSPPSALMPLQQSYGKASSTTTTSGISMNSAHWPTQQKNTPVDMRQSNADATVEGLRNEYLLDAVSNAQTTSASAAPNFFQPRSMPAIPEMDFLQNICASPATAPAFTWPATVALPTAASQATFQSPHMVETDARRPTFPLCHTDWASMQQPTPRSMPGSMMATSGSFSVPYSYGSPLPPSYTSIYNEEPSVGYPLLYGAQIPMPGIRTPSPQFVLGRSSETMVTTPAPLPADRVFGPPMYREDPTLWPGILSHGMLPVSLSREAESALPMYLDVYWHKVHPLYPIIHRATVEDGNENVSEQVYVLRCAMAAVATQFLGHPEHRINGSQLHIYAWQKSKAFTQSVPWSLPAMQCTLLCEYYARFRGRRKDDYQPSPRFLFMCQMVSAHRYISIPKLAGTKSQRWAAWIYYESHRRLLSACFLLSVHGMCYFEQPYSTVLGVDDMTSTFHIPLSGSTTSLWEAATAEAWADIDMSSIKLTTVGDVMQDESASNIENPAFDVSLVIAAHALQLPTRQQRRDVELVQDVSDFRCNDLLMFQYFSRRPGATTYLALHYTPLHALLAISGDTWVFNQKMPSIKVFEAEKRKLIQWRNSGTCAIATVFAARALRDFLSLSDDAAQIVPLTTPYGVTCKDISDYWGLYVCTLICWAFGHPAKPSCTEKLLPARTRAVRWIRAVAEMEPSQLQASSNIEDSQALIAFVRDILDKDYLGKRSMLFGDSVGVLRRIEERHDVIWF